MAIQSIINIDGVDETVTIVDVDITGSCIYLTYILDSTQEVFVIQEGKNRPYDIPTKIGDFLAFVPPGGGGGGTVTAITNVGTGDGVFKGMNGTIVELKTLLEGSNKLTITSNTNDLSFDIVESNLTLNNLGGTLSATKGGTGLTTYNTGDLIYASAANTLSALAPNIDGYVLTLAAGLPSWQPASGGGSGTVGPGTIGTFPIFTAATTVGDSSLSVSGTALLAEYSEISGKTDGTTNLGSATRRFATLFMASVINIAAGSSLQIGHGSNDLVVAISGNVLLGTSTDNNVNKLQVAGSVKFTESTGTATFGSSGLLDRLILLSGSATAHSSIRVGRTAEESSIASVGVNGQFSDISLVGDMVLRHDTLNMVVTVKNGTGHIKFTTGVADTEKMRLTNSGRFLIGTTTDDTVTLLQVNGGGKFTNGLVVNTDNDPTTVGNVPTWLTFVVSHAALQAASLTNNITLFALPAGCNIHGVKIKHTTSFSGGTIGSYTISLGITGNLTKYASAFDVFQVTGGVNQQLSNSLQTENNDISTDVKIAATSVGDNLSASVAGSVTIKVLVSNSRVL